MGFSKTGSGFHEKGCLGYGVGGDKLRSLLQEHQRNTVSFLLSDDIDLQHFFGTSFPLLGRGLYSMEAKRAGSRSFCFSFQPQFHHSPVDSEQIT